MSQQEGKPVSASRCVMTEMVLPNDANGLGNLMGGRLLYWMDVCAAISARRHADRVCVTASVDTVEFQSPIRVGEIIEIHGQVNRTFRTSMEVELNVWAQPVNGERRKANRAYYTFVSVDEKVRPVPVRPIIPETEDEIERYEHAARRRELRLILAGRLRLEDAAGIRDDLLAATQAPPSET
ncbi:MAG TPA: acyl-CoA thioesterase [Rhodothermales bacterium]